MQICWVPNRILLLLIIILLRCLCCVSDASKDKKGHDSLCVNYFRFCLFKTVISLVEEPGIPQSRALHSGVTLALHSGYVSFGVKKVLQILGSSEVKKAAVMISTGSASYNREQSSIHQNILVLGVPTKLPVFNHLHIVEWRQLKHPNC